MKKIAILGCGAMGTALGAYLAKDGLLVDMVDAYEPHVRTLNETGAHVLGREEFTVPVRAILPEQMDGIYDLVFLMTKQTVNEVVLGNLLPHLGKDSVVCTLQNGVPEPFVAQLVGAERTVGGTIQWGATFRGPGMTEVTSDLPTKREKNVTLFTVGEMDGSVTPRVEEIASILNRMGRTEISTTLMDARWSKLLYNCCASGMSTVCGSPFSCFLGGGRALECLVQIAREVAQCAIAEGRTMSATLMERLPDLEIAGKHFCGVYAAAADGKASMLQDLEAGRITEVDMLNGYVCAVGKKHGIATPYNDAVVSIVHRQEKGELPLSPENLQYFPN